MKRGDSVRRRGGKRTHAVASAAVGIVVAECGYRIPYSEALTNYGRARPCVKCARAIERGAGL